MCAASTAFFDARRLAITAATQAAVDAYEHSIDEYLEYRTSAMQRLKAALQLDPTMPMALCLQGYLFLLIGSGAVAPRALAALSKLQQQTSRLNPREKQHLQALQAWYAGDERRAATIWYRLLTEYPLDILAMKMLHSAAFWMGNVALLLNSVAAALPAWPESARGYSHVLGMQAFALEEYGDYAAAEASGRQAVEMNPHDLWALHAVAHVYEMQGRFKAGRELLARPTDIWDDRNPFKGHLWWHAALFCLAQGDYAAALDLYDRCIHSIESTFYLDVQNTASLLMRLQIRRVDIGHRWQELADIAEQQLDDHVLAFTEMHYAMALAADQRHDSVQRHLDSLQQFAKRKDHWCAAVMADVGISLCEAITHYQNGHYAKYVEQVMPIRYRLQQIGGSHAQRDVFEQMLVDAALKSAQLPLARALISERLTRQAAHPYNWHWFAEINHKLGLADEAKQAEQQYVKLL